MIWLYLGRATSQLVARVCVDQRCPCAGFGAVTTAATCVACGAELLALDGATEVDLTVQLLCWQMVWGPLWVPPRRTVPGLAFLGTTIAL